MSATLPRFSRGLKLTRIGVFLMLVQLVVVIVVTVKVLNADSGKDALDLVKWLRNMQLATIAATAAMCIGTVLAIPELAKFKVETTSMITAAISFAVSTVALVWLYRVLARFIDVATDPESTLADVNAVIGDLENVKWVTMVKDFTYGFALVKVLGMVQRSAAASDQLSLRDEAGHYKRAMMVMVAGDLFYQLTFGVSGGGIGIMGVIASLLVLGYWVWCHVKLTRFFQTAAYFMNEPHKLPVAIVREGKEPPARPSKPSQPPRLSQPRMPSAPPVRPSQPPARPSPVGEASRSQPPAPPPVAVAPPPMRPPTAPTAPKADDGPLPDGPRFLR